KPPLGVYSPGTLVGSTFRVAVAAAADGPNRADVHVGARINDVRSFSSCKPEYTGPLGLDSFFNNTIRLCRASYQEPKPGSRVQLVAIWDPPVRGYRYVKIEYQDDGGVERTAWVWAGQKPAYWQAVHPDSEPEANALPAADR